VQVRPLIFCTMRFNPLSPAEYDRVFHDKPAAVPLMRERDLRIACISTRKIIKLAKPQDDTIPLPVNAD